jgi:hypothetical protein
MIRQSSRMACDIEMQKRLLSGDERAHFAVRVHGETSEKLVQGSGNSSAGSAGSGEEDMIRVFMTGGIGIVR